MELRYYLGLSWTVAKLYIQHNQGREPGMALCLDTYAVHSSPVYRAHGVLPDLPLQIRASFKAIKPCVCCNGLGLFKYMALGMKLSMEHEIQL
jgi:ubiquitin-conjugating enzyme E2 Q